MQGSGSLTLAWPLQTLLHASSASPLCHRNGLQEPSPRQDCGTLWQNTARPTATGAGGPECMGGSARPASHVPQASSATTIACHSAAPAQRAALRRLAGPSAPLSTCACGAPSTLSWQRMLSRRVGLRHDMSRQPPPPPPRAVCRCQMQMEDSCPAGRRARMIPGTEFYHSYQLAVGTFPQSAAD